MEFRKFAHSNGAYAEARIRYTVALEIFDLAGRPAAAIPVASGTETHATALLPHALVTPT